MENVCKDLREHAMRIVNYEKKEMIPLSDEENKSYEKQNVYYTCKEEFSTDDYDDDNKYQKVRDHCNYTRKNRGAARNILNLRYKTRKQILVVFQNTNKNSGSIL